MRYFIWRDGYSPRDASEEDAESPEAAAKMFADFLSHTRASKSADVLYVTDSGLVEPAVYDVETIVTVDVKITRRP